MAQNDNTETASCSVDVTDNFGLTPGVPYYLIMQAQGEPTITNHVTNGYVTFTP